MRTHRILQSVLCNILFYYKMFMWILYYPWPCQRTACNLKAKVGTESKHQLHSQISKPHLCILNHHQYAKLQLCSEHVSQALYLSLFVSRDLNTEKQQFILVTSSNDIFFLIGALTGIKGTEAITTRPLKPLLDTIIPQVKKMNEATCCHRR